MLTIHYFIYCSARSLLQPFCLRFSFKLLTNICYILELFSYTHMLYFIICIKQYTQENGCRTNIGFRGNLCRWYHSFLYKIFPSLNKIVIKYFILSENSNKHARAANTTQFKRRNLFCITYMREVLKSCQKTKIFEKCFPFKPGTFNGVDFEATGV